MFKCLLLLLSSYALNKHSQLQCCNWKMNMRIIHIYWMKYVCVVYDWFFEIKWTHCWSNGSNWRGNRESKDKLFVDIKIVDEIDEIINWWHISNSFSLTLWVFLFCELFLVFGAKKLSKYDIVFNMHIWNATHNDGQQDDKPIHSPAHSFVWFLFARSK